MDLIKSAETEKTWLRLFPDADYQLQMSLHLGDATRYWSRLAQSEHILAERRHWLTTAPERHFIFLEESRAAVKEAVAWLAKITGLNFVDAHEAACGLEPDWVLLAGDEAGSFPVIGGAVTFPSDWALEEKVGQPLGAVHAPVPELETALGAKINSFFVAH